jgi:hypothetical protein
MLSSARNGKALELDSLAATRFELNGLGEGEDWALAEATARIAAAPRRLVSLTSGIEERKSDICGPHKRIEFSVPGKLRNILRVMG